MGHSPLFRNSAVVHCANPKKAEREPHRVTIQKGVNEIGKFFARGQKLFRPNRARCREMPLHVLLLLLVCQKPVFKKILACLVSTMMEVQLDLDNKKHTKQVEGSTQTRHSLPPRRIG